MQAADQAVIGVFDDAGNSPPHRAVTVPSMVLRHRLMQADVVAVTVGVFFAFAWQELVRPVPGYVRLDHLLLVILSLPAWAIGYATQKLHTAGAVARRGEEIRRVLKAHAVGTGAIVALAFVTQYQYLSRLWVIALYLSVSGAILFERTIARRLFARLRREGRINRRIVIVGTDAAAIGLMHTVQRRPECGYEIVGFVGDDDLASRGGVSVLGTVDEVGEVLASTDATGVMVSLSSIDPDVVNRLTRRLTDDGYHVALSSSLRDIDVSRFRPQEIDGRTLIYVEPTIRNGWRATAKRVFDLGFAGVMTVLTAPVILVAAIAIKLDSRGPVIFRQTRVGQDGVEFPIFKLRTMVQDAEARKAELQDHNESDGPLFKMRDDPRVTRVGRLLRKLSIDELPQFWNVVRGEMSVVGPRPALPTEVAEWPPDVHDRLRVLPGITGMWQVSGRSDTSFDEYKRLDLYYVDNWSLSHDVQIVAKTFTSVVLQRGAH